MVSESTDGGDTATRRYAADVISVPGIVSIWAGRLADEDALDDYVAFRYPPDDEGWSPFTRDHGLPGIDEDFAESAWWERGPYSFVDHSYGESFAPTADVDLARRMPAASCAYLLYDIDATRISASKGSPLAFLGAYPYQK
ncbi:hypothetical protein GCM10027416_23250 [Okibacterium endophyticum]